MISPLGNRHFPYSSNTTKLCPYYEVGIPISLPRRMYPYLKQNPNKTGFIHVLPWPITVGRIGKVFQHIFNITNIKNSIFSMYSYLIQTGLISSSVATEGAGKISKVLQHII